MHARNTQQMGKSGETSVSGDFDAHALLPHWPAEAIVDPRACADQWLELKAAILAAAGSNVCTAGGLCGPEYNLVYSMALFAALRTGCRACGDGDSPYRIICASSRNSWTPQEGDGGRT